MSEAGVSETVIKTEEKKIETLPLFNSETASAVEGKSSKTQPEVADPSLAITDKIDSVNQEGKADTNPTGAVLADLKIKPIEKDSQTEIKGADAASAGCKLELAGEKNNAKIDANPALIDTKVEAIDKGTNCKVETKVTDATSNTSAKIESDDNEKKSEIETKATDAELLGAQVGSADKEEESKVEMKMTHMVPNKASDINPVVEVLTAESAAATAITQDAVHAVLPRKEENKMEILGGGDVGEQCRVSKTDKNAVTPLGSQNAKISSAETGERKLPSQKEIVTKGESGHKASLEKSNAPNPVESKETEPITISRLKQVVQKTAEERDVYHRKLEETERKLAALQSSYDAVMKGDSNESSLRRMIDQLKSKLIQTSLQLEDRTRLAANQEKQINALSSQVVSLKEVESITRNLLQIRNMEVKQLQTEVDDMEVKISQERERYSTMINKMNAAVQLNADLKKEYETQLRLFQDLRGKYEEKVTLLSNEKRALETAAATQSK